MKQNQHELPAAIGNTPLVGLKRINKAPNVRIFAKIEGNNPGGSVKDRTVWWMIRHAEDNAAFEMARQLAGEEGLFVGMSSGAAVAGALQTAETMESGIVVNLLPDRGDRYLSTTLFRSVCASCRP